MSVRPLNACRKVVNHRASNLASCGIGLVPLYGRDLRKSNSLFVKRLAAVVHFVVCSTFPMKDCISCLVMLMLARKALHIPAASVTLVGVICIVMSTVL